MQKEERVALLDDAVRMIETASNMITEAVKGTLMEIIADDITSAMHDIILSDTKSIDTLKKNIMNNDDGLIWTRPLVSVKEADRRDI